jgi:hypothetical protein
MIVLDEQLLGRSVEREIKCWYRGSVVFVTELRPGTVIKDEAIPSLLREQDQPTFVTINGKDFWRRVDPDRGFCLVCIPLPDSRAREIPGLLRRLLRHPMFRTKSARMGKVVRLAHRGASYYTIESARTCSVALEAE